MGIKGFFKIVCDPNKREYRLLGKEVKLSDYADERLAVDAMNKIYRAFLASKDWRNLTDTGRPDGNPTVHIKIIISQIAMYKSNGVETIWVFDNRKLTAGKEAETEKRKALRQRYHKPDASGEMFEMKAEYIEDIMKLLKLCGIPYLEAPPDYEAEHIAGILCQGENPYCYGVLSDDSDTLVYGAPIMIRTEKIYSKTGKSKKNIFKEYVLDEILEASAQEYDEEIYEETLEALGKQPPKRKQKPKAPVGALTLEDLQYISVLLGNDFCKGIKGIGPGTVLWKAWNSDNEQNYELTEDQEFALSIYQSTVKNSILKKNFQSSEPDEEGFEEFLNEKGFSQHNIIKLKDQIFL